MSFWFVYSTTRSCSFTQRLRIGSDLNSTIQASICDLPSDPSCCGRQDLSTPSVLASLLFAQAVGWVPNSFPLPSPPNPVRDRHSPQDPLGKTRPDCPGLLPPPGGFTSGLASVPLSPDSCLELGSRRSSAITLPVTRRSSALPQLLVGSPCVGTSGRPPVTAVCRSVGIGLM